MAPIRCHTTVLPIALSAADPLPVLKRGQEADGSLAILPCLRPATMSAEGGEPADVVVLDARNARPMIIYRQIDRMRAGGWQGGLTLLVRADELHLVPTARALGADDFITDSMSPAEVAVRLQPPRRTARLTRPQADDTGIQFHWRTHEISVGETRANLTLREMQLLDVFLERRGATMTGPELARLAWGKPTETGSALAAAYVCSLRKKLAWFGGRFGIRTVAGAGYRFDA